MSVPKTRPARRSFTRGVHPALVLLVGLALPVAACGSGAGGEASGSRGLAATGTRTATGTTGTRTATGTTGTTGTPGRPDTSGSPARSSSPSADPGATCVNKVASRMSQEQRVGQLFMTAVSSAGMSRAESAALKDHSVGSVILMGHSSAGASHVKSVTDRVQSSAPTVGGARVRLFTAADQEGGQVQVLKGPGFSPIPDAVTQGQWPISRLERNAADWGRQLRAAGVTLDLAPVADTVPDSLGEANEPIGRYGRQYGSTPEEVAPRSSAFVRGLTKAGVSSTVKHFPGLGNVRGNTDFSADVTDTVTPRTGAYQAPFRGGIRAGARFAMVSSATYTRIDPSHQAVFSSVVLRDMLREDLGFDGVIISDDLGNAAAVRAISPAQRAVRFLAAGGDMVLTVKPSTIRPMTQAVLARMRTDATFRADVERSVRRVLTEKREAGLLTCQS